MTDVSYIYYFFVKRLPAQIFRIKNCENDATSRSALDGK